MLYPFASRWLEVPEGDLHYVDEGEGRPILLMHGNPTWSFLNRKLIVALRRRGFRCIAVDLLGYGLSSMSAGEGLSAKRHGALVASLLSSLDLRELIVVGQDWGGPIGLSAACQVADRVRGVVLGQTFAFPVDSFFMRLVARVLNSAWGQRQMLGERFVRRVVKSLLRTSLSDAELGHYALPFPTPASRRPLLVLPRELRDAGPWLETLEAEVRQQLGTRKALLLHGGFGERLLGATTNRFSTMFPNHVIEPLGNAGHYFQEDAPEWLADRIVTHFGA